MEIVEKHRERCMRLYRSSVDADAALAPHLITDEVGDIYPADTDEARAAVEASGQAFEMWADECGTTPLERTS